MERKRKLPARAVRVESVSKKRTSTPPEPRAQPAPPPQAPIEETLPKSITSGKPLPTLVEPQAENLPAEKFQSISESGVLAESLQRSRSKWLTEGIFERYWTKPTAKNKKNGSADLPNNPAKDTMTKLGTCTIYVEPHVFDATMFAIKEPHPKPALTSLPPQHMYRPIIQYGPPNGVMPPPPPPPPPVQHKPTPPPQPIQNPTPASEDTPMTNSESAVPTTTNPSTLQQLPNRAIPNGQTSSNNPAQSQQQPPKPPAPSANNSTPGAPTKSTDPVIQMLAERAALDPDLKGLMRIVANGEASPEDLKKFQIHIDELARLQKSRQAASQPNPPQNKPPPPTPPPAPTQAKVENIPPQNPAPAPVSKSAPTPPASRPEPHYQPQPQPQALRSKGPVPSTKPDISGVVFEFTGGSGDRFLFPKFSILEYLPQGQVIASFLIVRKGSSSDSPTYDPELDYYQPITIRLYAHQGRQLEALQKIVAHPEEVRRYMDDIMDNMTRAEYVLLAMRLPKDIEQPAIEKDDAAEKAAEVNNQALWVTTHPTPAPAPAPQMKPVPRLLTEEEKYQSFIATVS